MNIQLGIYEIFSTIIPGIVYLAALGELLLLFKVISLDWKSLNNLSFISALALLVVAYLLGLAFSSFGVVWHKIFKRKNQSVESLNIFKRKHKNRWAIDVEDDDWDILLAYIRSKNIDLAREVERHLATSIMLRSVSFGILLMAAIKLLEYFLTGYSISIIATILLFVFSILMLRQSMKFRGWYYDTILSTIVSYRVDLEKSIKPVSSSAKRSKGNKKGE